MKPNNTSTLHHFWANWRCLTLIILGFGYNSGSMAMHLCAETVGRVASIEGTVEIQHADHTDWHPAKLDIKLCKNDSIHVGRHSRAAVSLINEAVLRLNQNTTIQLTEITQKEEEKSILDILKGMIQFFSRQPHKLSVNTPYLNGVIEGTEFLVEVSQDHSILSVLEGKVTASNNHGRVQVTAGESAVAKAGSAPVLRTMVNPQDAVQWSFYYPPVLALSGSSDKNKGEMPGAALESALKASSTGDSPRAFAILDSIPDDQRNAEYYLYRAALLLSVGQVDPARQNIDRSLELEPDNGLTYALRAIIAVVLDQREQALKYAERAVAISDSSAANIALSYAQQANFRIQDAKNTLLKAVAEYPDDPLAWARLSELHLMLGDRSASKDAAEKAIALNPQLARTQLVLGYAALAEFRNDDAISAFHKAIRLESADPLAHLGLGLAKISTGDLKRGRNDIEVAVGLDSNNSLLRSYLGKAYFEEKRYPLDSKQYGIAKNLDPLDPTPYLYDGILKQTINRPIEAVKDLEKSIELNDNRSVYRSRLLLDKDRAARGTSLARAYNDLGFNQLGINASTKSLGFSPSNSSAHRFLSDTYRNTRRRESARVSELLQAQMMQDININPIQPSISATNLNIVTQGGPANPGFDEYTPLFEQNRVQLDATGVVGNHNTYSGEGVLSGIYDRLSLSGGAFYYDTDGFRPNYDLKHEIYNVYSQIAIMPELNVQAEFQHRKTKHGDLAVNFDPDDFSPNKRNNFEGNSARFGERFTPSEKSNFLFSFIYGHRDIEASDSRDVGQNPVFGSLNLVTDAKSTDDAFQYEGLYIYEHDVFNITLGGAYADIEREDVIDSVLETTLAGDISRGGDPLKDDINDYRGYLYTNINLPSPVTWTLGVSYQNHDENAFKLSRVLPKAGIQWDITDSLRLRGAYFQTIKPVLATNRTLEPTQIAGFNQIFDDADATESERYGWGLDWNALQSLRMGVEMSWRDLSTPRFDLSGNTIFEEPHEWHHHAYIDWMPTEQFALNLKVIYDNFENQQHSVLAEAVPDKVKTLSVPITALYFHQSGLFGALGVTYVNQEVRRAAFSARAQGVSNFPIVDLGVGYRFPKRLGILSLSIQNLFDEKFNFQDDSYREFGDQPSIGPYIPDITITGRLTLNF